MKVAFKSLVAAAAFIAAGAASAATVDVTVGTTVYKGLKVVSGSETLRYSSDMRALQDVLITTVTAVAPATVVTDKDSDGAYTAIDTSAPMTSLSVNDVTNQLLSATSAGGHTMVVTPRKYISTGGSLSVTDLSVDLATKRVYATLVGANGVGTLTHFNLWNIGTLTGSDVIGAPVNGATIVNLTASGLSLTPDGFNAIATSLGLGNLGKSAMQGVADFGTIDMTAMTEPATLPPSACTLTYKATKTSPNVFTAAMTLGNNVSNAATGWKINWKYGSPTLILHAKNAKVTDKNSTAFTAQPVAANETIPANGSTDISLRAYSRSAPPTISELSATLGGQACKVSVQ
jgi:hypothetical protein